jgi:hypothetical protein
MKFKLSKILWVLYNLSSIFAVITGVSVKYLFLKNDYSWYWILIFSIGVIYSVWLIYVIVKEKYRNKFAY